MSEQDVIAWFDPGLTTGGAVYNIANDGFMSGQYTTDRLPGLVEAMYDKYGDHLAVGYELYIQTPRPRPGSKAKYSNEAIAAIDAACEEYSIPVLRGQPSSARMFKSTVVFLRRLGWYRQGMPHANDAACHLFRHLIRMKPVPENIRRALPPGY